jgi:hypothetical protein
VAPREDVVISFIYADAPLYDFARYGLRKTLNDRTRPPIAETGLEIIVAHCSSSHWWGDEGDAKVFEMPFIRRDDRQVIDSGGRGNCRVLKAGPPPSHGQACDRLPVPHLDASGSVLDW